MQRQYAGGGLTAVLQIARRESKFDPGGDVLVQAGPLALSESGGSGRAKRSRPKKAATRLVRREAALGRRMSVDS